MKTTRHRSTAWRHGRRMIMMVLLAVVFVGEVSDVDGADEPVARDGILLQAEGYASRHPADESFARTVRDMGAVDGQAIARFFSKDGRCAYRFTVVKSDRFHLWLRYASNQKQRVVWALDPRNPSDRGAANVVQVPGTGSLTGLEAWRWAKLGDAALKAGNHQLILYGCAIRPDAIWISRKPAAPNDQRIFERRMADARKALDHPIEPITPDWLATAGSYELPGWYDSIRVCAHTRLTWSWLKKDPELFLGAGRRFASLGFAEYARHIKSGSEPAWWASRVGAIMPEARAVNYAKRIIDEAHANGCRILVYHRHMEDAWVAEQHPDWVARDFRGEPIVKRGPKVCFNSPYADFVQTRLEELVKMGVDGLYFDEVHMPKPFCWCDHCRRKFEAETDMKYPAKPDPFDPAYQKAIEFKNVTIERVFRRWRKAIHALNHQCVLLIGSNTYPQMSDRHTTHRLYRIADSMKTEFSLPARGLRSPVFQGDRGLPRPEVDVMLALGYAIARDACDGRPPHVWVHGVPNSLHARFATAGLIAHGCIANLDQPEKTIPDRALFADAVALGNRMAPGVAQSRPLRWGLVHFSEHARDYYLPEQREAWQQVLLPTYGAFATLLRHHLPVGIITDSQLEQGLLDGCHVLIIPAPRHLTDRMRRAIDAFTKRGGTVIQQQDAWQWHQHEGGIRQASDALLEAIGDAAKRAPVRVQGGPTKMHVMSFRDSPGKRITVALVNDFSWVFTGRAITRDGAPNPAHGKALARTAPTPCRGVEITVHVPAGVSRATELVSGRDLPVVMKSVEAHIRVPDFECAAMIVLEGE